MRRAAVLGIYRARFAQRFARQLRREIPSAWPTRLWALDESHSALEDRTVGEGPGDKFDLLNRLLAEPLPPDCHVAVLDDDIQITPFGVRALIGIGERAGFGLWQPAHGRRSHLSHPINRRQPGSVARETTFVEIGPVFVVAASWRHHFLPFPSKMGMGWGLELIWSRARAQGCRLGVVDVVRVRHPEVPNTTYSARTEIEEARLRRLLAEEGLHELAEAQHTLATWRLGQVRPPWAASG